jgi:hypothetical protein
MKRNIQQNDTKCSIMLSIQIVAILSVVYAECRKQAHYSESHYAENDILSIISPPGPNVMKPFLSAIYDFS